MKKKKRRQLTPSERTRIARLAGQGQKATVLAKQFRIPLSRVYAVVSASKGDEPKADDTVVAADGLVRKPKGMHSKAVLSYVAGKMKTDEMFIMRLMTFIFDELARDVRKK